MNNGGRVEDSSSCLDHCYTNVPEKIISTKVVPVGNSDHMGIVVRKLTKFQASRPQVIKKRSYKHFNAEAFLVDILTSNINTEVLKEHTVDGAAEKFETMFKKVLDNHAPERKIQMRSNYHPFISEETKILITERRSLQLRAISSDCKQLKKEFNRKNKEVKRRMKEDKKNYFEEKFKECDSKNVWRTANELLGSVKNLSPTNILHKEEVDCNPKMVTNPERIASIFNDFFVQKVKNLRQKSMKEPLIPPVERLRKLLAQRDEPPPPFTLKKIGFSALRKAIRRMKGKRSCGVDLIDSYSLKLAAPLIEDALLHLINLSIETGTFAKNWKPQLIMPTFKKKDRNVVENYRPVSNLVETGKLVEYVVAEQIMSHFLLNNLFHRNHHGSLPDHSTATAIIQLTDMWMEAAEKKKFTGVCMIDQSAAYDLLDHEIFADKLHEYNFDDKSILWIKSYLSGRTQCVRVESKQSPFIKCEESGSPQGSIMSGIFHIMNSNDLPACHDDAESIVYVDDDTDNVQDGDPENLAAKLQLEVQETVNWLKDNRMCVAGDKSKLLIVGTRELRASRLQNGITIMVDGNEIIESTSEKLLGVTVNNTMTWKEHLYGDAENMGLISQLKQRVGTLKRLSRYTSRKSLRMLASGIFYSKLEYCLPVFGNYSGIGGYGESSKMRGMTAADCNKLQVLQNSVNRILTGARVGTRTEDLLNETNTISVHQMIAFSTLLMVFKVLKSGKPTYIARKLGITREAGMAMRGWDGLTVKVPNYYLDISRGGFIYRGAKLFNKLPRTLREEKRTEAFKTELKIWVRRNVSIKPS